MEGETGCRVPPGEIAPLVERLHELLAAPDRRAAMGAAARCLAEAQFDPAANAARMMAIYDRLLR